MLTQEMKGLSGQKLLTYLSNNLRSVTVLREEADLMDKKYKTTMPNPNKIFSRFDEYGIVLEKFDA